MVRWILLFHEWFALSAPFLSTWNTTWPEEAIKGPVLEALSNLTIEWGDGQDEMVAEGSQLNFTHTFLSAGEYMVAVTGDFLWINDSPNVPKSHLMDISSWGGLTVSGSQREMFSWFANLRVSAPSSSQPRLLPGASLAYCFAYTKFDAQLDWDVVNVTDLTGFFAYTPMSKPVTLTNTQNVLSVQGMFRFAPNFNQPVAMDVSSVTDTSYMFEYATSFNQVVKLVNSRKVTTTERMFSFASVFNQPFSLETDSVTSMDSMFFEASRFNQALHFTNLSQVTTFSHMFFRARAFNQLVDWEDTRNLQSTELMFAEATSLDQPVTLNTTSTVTMGLMFFSASNFSKRVNFTSTSLVTDMSFMFTQTRFEQDVSSWDAHNVRSCPSFCMYCALPTFTLCTPCAVMMNEKNQSVCHTHVTASGPPTFNPPAGLTVEYSSELQLCPLFIISFLAAMTSA